MEGELFAVEDRFQFIKNSYVTVGSILKNCIKLLTSPKTGMTQPLFIGDSRGILYVTEYKKQEPEVKVKTQPFSREITCVDYSSTVNKERIYFSFGNSIFITNRGCKDYSKIEFDIADNISQFRAMENMIWTVSNNYVSKYEYGESTMEKGTFDNEADITALCLSEFFGKTNPVCLIGSQDNKIKVVSGKDLIYSLPLNSYPTTITQYKSSHHDLSEDNFLFGTMSGSHGLVNLDKESMKVLWELNKDGKGGNRSLSELVAIKTFDINYDGVNEIICIHTNGDVNIYSTGKTILDTSLISRYETHENLTGIDVGKFRTEEENEIMLSSYSGLIFSLTPRIDMPNISKVTPVDKKTLQKNLKETQQEVDLLKQLYEKRLSEFQKQQTNVFNPVSKNPFKVNYKLNLQTREAVYHLKIESEFPMELVLMQSNGVSLEIIEILTKDVNLNIIKDKSNEKIEKEIISGSNFSSQSQTLLNVNEQSNFLCTFKLKESVHVLEILLRTYENISDVVNCTIIPYNKPKTALTLEIPIKALSLHKKEEDLEEINKEFSNEENITSLNVLTIKGRFQAAEINQILSEIVPDIPEKTSKDNLKYYLKSTFLKTLIEVVIDSNYCSIKSVYMTPLIIIKEQITKVASNRKRDMEFSIQIKTLSIFRVLELIDPMIKENFNLETKFKIIQAFKEIDIGKNNILVNELPEEYQSVLNNSEEIVKKHEQRSINLHYLKALIENLLRDVSKVRSMTNLPQKIKDLDHVFEDYSYDKLVEIFKELKNI
jgi:Bardet-Biedl syndrome 7 protein